MKTGKHRVSVALGIFAVLMASDAGRDSENGTGAMWVAPELVAGSALVQTCARQAGQNSELVFETLEPGDIDSELPRLLAMAAREVVEFEWHSATGELSFSTTAPSAVFSDLELPTSQASVPTRLNCGSR